MKKFLSILLTAILAISVFSFGAVSASAAEDEPAPAIAAGEKIFFDNTETQWTDIYFYAWSYGFFGDFVPMEASSVGENLYEVVAPIDVPDGAEYFLFTNTTNWSGQQTPNQSVTAGFNTYKPVFDETGAMTVEKSLTAYTPGVEVAITPYSKNFTDSLEVTVYAFNTGESTATYQLNSETPVEFTEPTTLNLTSTTTVTVSAGTASKTYTFTKIADAVVNVEVPDYTGDLYVYTYGGDRVAPGFAPMIALGDDNYTFTINGSAHVIFTTTDDWSTAVKFLIYDENMQLLDNQEPLVSSGETVSYILELPVVTEE